MIYDLCAKENWLSSFSFFQHTSHFFFFSLSPSTHTHSHREIPDSWPTCLGSLMLSSVVPDISTSSSFIIRRLCTNMIPLLRFLIPSPSLGGKETADINVSPFVCFPQECRVSGWRWSRRCCHIPVRPSTCAVPSPMPLGFSSQWSDTHCHDTIVFFVSVRIWLFLYNSTLISTPNWVCNLKF